MSLKLEAFRLANIAPQTADRYSVLLPSFYPSLLKVTSTSLPFPQSNEGVIHFLGKQYFVPTSRNESGIWSCSMLEDISLMSKIGITFHRKKASSRKCYIGDILIFVTDQPTGEVPLNVVTLRRAWLVGVEPVNLSWSDPTTPVQYKLNFRYNGISSIL